jgi:hypothetical protein
MATQTDYDDYFGIKEMLSKYETALKEVLKDGVVNKSETTTLQDLLTSSFRSKVETPKHDLEGESCLPPAKRIKLNPTVEGIYDALESPDRQKRRVLVESVLSEFIGDDIPSTKVETIDDATDEIFFVTSNIVNETDTKEKINEVVSSIFKNPDNTCKISAAHPPSYHAGTQTKACTVQNKCTSDCVTKCQLTDKRDKYCAKCREYNRKLNPDPIVFNNKYKHYHSNYKRYYC